MAHQSPASDDELMAFATDGDTDAFGLLVARHKGRIERFLYRLSWDEEEALDGAQETFLRLWLVRDQYTGQGKLVSYLYRIARNWWLNRQRDCSARPRLSPGGDLSLTEGAEATALRNEDIHRTRMAIRDLPEPQRMVFILGCMEDLPYEQIADILDIPVGTVKSRMHHAMRKLRAALTHEEEG